MAISRMLRGKRRMQMDEAGAIAKILGVPLEDVLQRAGLNTRIVERFGVANVAGLIDAEARISLDVDEGEQVPLPIGMESGAKAFIMRTAFTNMHAYDHWTVYANWKPECICFRTDTGLCVIAYGAKRFLAFVKRGYGHHKYDYMLWGSPDWTENVTLSEVCPVSWIGLN